MQAAPNEQTPEGHAAAVAARQAQHPIVTGLGEAAGDVWDAVKSMANPLNTGLRRCHYTGVRTCQRSRSALSDL